MFSEDDKKEITEKGFLLKKVEQQINNYKTSFPFANIIKAANIGDGIKKLNPKERKELIKYFDDNSNNLKITKFTPASGAASRMFKDLFSFADSNESISENEFINTFYSKLNKFAFYGKLSKYLSKNNIDQNEENLKQIIDSLLTENGLNYGNLPKGLLLFHKYENEIRTAFAEHLIEGALYAKGKNNVSDIVFTVSRQHKKIFTRLYNKLKPEYEKRYNITYNIQFTEQQKSTDIIAVNMDNTPFKNENGELLFRPGGHGALIENLNNIESDIIFIKNIDNVVHEKHISKTVEYKKVLAGELIRIKNIVFNYIKLLENPEKINDKLVLEIIKFTEDELSIIAPKIINNNSNETIEFLKRMLNRPIRVCGMVKNEGEAGGGPYWVKSDNNSIQLQIAESSEIDQSKNNIIEIMNNATHFNPVDIVCSTLDYKGEKFNLNNYINHNAGFITEKSINGKSLKAQELPGLWNGAMANWNTIFIEVPIKTFVPVKNVNDLLRPQHQS